MGTGSHDYGGWESHGVLSASWRTRKTGGIIQSKGLEWEGGNCRGWGCWYKSQSLRAWEAGTPLCESRRRLMSGSRRLRVRWGDCGRSLTPCFPQRTGWCSYWWEWIFLSLLIQMLKSENTLPDTPRINSLLDILVSLSPAKLMSKIYHHSYQHGFWGYLGWWQYRR